MEDLFLLQKQDVQSRINIQVLPRLQLNIHFRQGLISKS